MSFPRKIISLVLPRPLVDRVENWRPFWFATTALVLAGCLQLYFPTLVSTLVDSTLQGWLSSFHGDTPATSEWKASANSSVNGLMLLATVTGIILLTYWEIRGFSEAGERAKENRSDHV
jgi:alpha-D-ribose 1-methylphosphonate 5-triphosphate synthase subunit PhnH